MLSIAPLASPDYYLGSAVSSGEAFAYFEANKGTSDLTGPGHAPGMGSPSTTDPLLRHGRWLGHYGAKLGLASDSPIRAADFEAIYYGLNPRTGKPLRSDGKSRKAQMADAKERMACKQALELSSRAYNQIRADLRSIEKSIGNAMQDPAAHLLKLAHASARSRLDTAADTVRATGQAYQHARQKSLRPGTDLVFSAPKSVSMQWAALASSGDAAGAQVIEQAHDLAVRETFDRLQAEFVMTRKRDPETSRRIFETVQGVIASQWRHFDARPTERVGAVSGSGSEVGADPARPAGVPDPQLHDHINLFAPVQGADGLIYAAYTDYIRQNIKALGAMYRARLASNLSQAGYQIERDVQKNGLFFSLCGIGRDQAKALSARTTDIEALMAQGKSSRNAKLHSRLAKNSLTGTEVLDAWAQSFVALGLDPNAVKAATVHSSVEREIRIKNIPAAARLGFEARLLTERTGRSRTDAQILEELLSRDAHFTLSDIRQMLWEDAQFAVAGQTQMQAPVIDLDAVVEARLRSLLQIPDLLRVFDPDEPALGGQCTGLNRFGEPVFTTRSLRLRETQLFGETVPALLSSNGYGVEQTLALRIVRETETRLSARSEQKGKPFALRDFQLRAVLQAACGDGQLAIQIAGAGLGKTTASQFTKEILVSQGRRIIGVAPSNKAASGLGRELGIDACSIDRLLFDLASGKQTLDRKTVVFVDEAGMAGFDNMEKLLEWARETGAKLILTGDPEQLPAVARGNVLRKLTQMDALVSNPQALLYLGRHLGDWDRVSRQKADWAKQASTFFSRGYVDEGLREYERRGCLHSALTSDHLGEDVADAYLKDSAPGSQKLILATTNDQVRALNQRVRTRLKAQGALTGSWVLPETGMELSLGDRVVFKARLKGHDAGLHADVAKNEFGTLLSISRRPDGSLDIQCQLDTALPNGKPQIARFNSRALEDLDHAFATTVHRSQGMTVDSVIAVPGSFISKELFYVMASRHRQSLQIHMLESDKASIRIKAAQGIVKRHANDLLAIQTRPQEARERLQVSDARLAELDQQERSRFEKIILAPLRAWDARLRETNDKQRQALGHAIDQTGERHRLSALAAKAIAVAQWTAAATLALLDRGQRGVALRSESVGADNTVIASGGAIMTTEAMVAILRLRDEGPSEVRSALQHIQSVEDAVTAGDTVAFGRMVDLLARSGTAAGDQEKEKAEELGRVAKGWVVHEDSRQVYLALPDHSRLLVVSRQELARVLDATKLGSLALQEIEVRFDAVTARVTDVVLGTLTPATDQDQVQTQDPASKADWLADQDPVSLRQQLAAVCMAQGLTSKVQALEQGSMAIVDLTGHRGNTLEGWVLGVSRDHAYMLSGLEVVRVSRSEAAFNQLDEAGFKNMVGSRCRFAIRNGRAVALQGLAWADGTSPEDQKTHEQIVDLAPGQ